jgi:hypothetical protein
MKIVVFWNVAKCSLVHIDRVSDEITSFIMNMKHVSSQSLTRRVL